jgi:hypothetical protein
MPIGTEWSFRAPFIGGFQIKSARKQNDVFDFKVFGIKMTRHTGVEEKPKK